jgi:tRNA(fMet)-specific endonuclease VapC
MHLLDTNVCIDILAGSAAIDSRLEQVNGALMFTSAVTVAELLYGAARSTQPVREATRIRWLLRDLPIIPVDARVAQQYATIKVVLSAQGLLLEDNDLFIAATALSRGLTLVTHDKGFARVPNLLTEDWLA